MGILHTKKYGIYHWDTFDNETIFITETDTIEEAEKRVKEHYKDRINNSGADRVDIVDERGNIVKHFSII